MAVGKVLVSEFLELAKSCPVIDVRSPAEYLHAHIPGAISLPLFSDDERKIVGTAYKQESREKAIKKGLEFFGPKMVRMVEEVERIASSREWGDGRREPARREVGDPMEESIVGSQKSEVGRNGSGLTTRDAVLIHCWRGGMRSAAVGWLADLYGLKVYLLEGGYKAFRKSVLQQFEKDFPIKIIGGYTGSGKTEILNALRERGERVLDLEALANHKGSAFGAIGLPPQPSPEMFENELGFALMKSDTGKNFNNFHPAADHPPPTLPFAQQSETIWVEDESQRIGNINIPHEFWRIMRSKPVIFLDVPFEERLGHILQSYGKADKEKLINAVIRIKKRLGGLETKVAVNYLLEDNVKECFRILLNYYDKWYKKGLESREEWKNLISEIKATKVDASLNASLILLHETKEQNA